jgi:hypothetical protein
VIAVTFTLQQQWRLQTLELAGVQFVPLLPSPMDETSVHKWLIDHHNDHNDDDDDDDLGLTLTAPQQQQQTIMSQTIHSGTEGNAICIQLCLNIMANAKTTAQEAPAGWANFPFPRMLLP